MVEHQLLLAEVTHARTKPKKHAFQSKVMFFVIDLAHSNRFKFRPWLNSAGLGFYRFKKNDYGILGKQKTSPEDFIKNAFKEKNKKIPIFEKVQLITTISCLGYTFNPISFYLLFSSVKETQPTAVVLEVSNTFHEKKLYVLGSEEMKQNQRMTIFELLTEKEFYISPFISVATNLKIRLSFDDKGMSANVISQDQDTVILAAHMSGTYAPISHSELAKQSFKVPLQGLRVMALIHWHALLLWLKKIPFYSKSAQIQLQKGLLHDTDS